MCTPGMRRLKEINPRCRIYFYTHYPELVRGLWYLDEVLSSVPRKYIEMTYAESIPRAPHCHLSKIMAAKIGVRVKDVRPDCVVDVELLKRFKIAWRDLPRPHIIVQRRAGPYTPNKDWPDESWKSLLEMLLQTCTVIEIGTEVGGTILASSNYVDLRGKTSLAELAAAICAADVLVGPDSGPLHVAAAVKTPAVVILGGYIIPENTAYAGNRILHTPIHCSPCWLTTPCPYDRECLRRISVQMVKKEIEEAWTSTNKVVQDDHPAQML